VKTFFLSLSILIFLVAMAGNASGRTCRIVFLNGPDGPPESLQMFDGAAFQEVELPRMNLSPVYKLPEGDLNLRFFSSPPGDPTKLPEGAPAVKVLEAMTDFYLIVTSDPKNEIAPVRVQAVSADSTQLGRGEMLWFNLTEKRVGGVIGSEKLDIKAGDRKVVGEPRSGRGDYPAELYFRIEGDDFIHPLCETIWRHDPRSRSLVFVINEGGRRVPRIVSFSDFRAREDGDR